MKILLIANYPLAHQESMQRFASMLDNGLRKKAQEVRVTSPKPIVCKAKHAEDGINKWLGYIDRFILFPFHLKRESKWADIIHICDHSNAMYSKWVTKPTLVTCHDLMAIKSGLGMVETNKTGFTGRLLQKWIVSGLKASSHIDCVSMNTQKELIDIVNIDKERTSVAYNAFNYPYAPMDKEKSKKLISKYLSKTNKSYFFHLGGNQWYKNRKGVAEIFSHLIQLPEYKNHILVLAGKPWSFDLREKIMSLGIEDSVVEVCNLSNEEIRAFYSASTAMIFPSFEEGFGWPIIEAQACGAIVVTTNRAPMTEVGGNAAIYIEPEEPLLAANIIQKNLNEEKKLQALGIKNAKRFSIDEMINSYLQSYKKIR